MLDAVFPLRHCEHKLARNRGWRMNPFAQVAGVVLFKLGRFYAGVIPDVGLDARFPGAVHGNARCEGGGEIGRAVVALRWTSPALVWMALAITGCSPKVEYRAAGPPPQGLEKPAADAESVPIAEVTPEGLVSGPVSVPKVVLPVEEWRARLTPLGFAVMRTKATELAFTGRYDKHYAAGVYRCAGCNTALFLSTAKFDSHTGWPSFTAPVAAGNVYTQVDSSFGQARDEVLCRRCDAHLGHVFPDGPEPNGLRYCMNSAALRFEAARPGTTTPD